MVAAGVADEILVQVAYAIGVADPVSIFVNTFGTCRCALTDGQIARKIADMFDLRPAAIVKRFGLTYPIFEATAAYGHFGRQPYSADVTLFENGQKTVRKAEFFAWEKLDEVETIKAAFGI